MKTKRWTSAVCLLLCLLLLSACGSPEKKLQKEDAAIRAAMEQEGFGYGDKLAIYENALQQYSYHRYELPASLQAEKPEATEKPKKPGRPRKKEAGAGAGSGSSFSGMVAEPSPYGEQ